MGQLRQMQKEVEGVQHQLLCMLAKFAIGFTGFTLLLCWLTKIKSMLIFSIWAIALLIVGFFLFKRWYNRYKLVRTYFFILENDYKKRTNKHIKEVQEAMNGLLYIRKF